MPPCPNRAIPLHRILDHTGDFFAEALEIFQILGELPAGPPYSWNAIKISPANRRPNKALSVGHELRRTSRCLPDT